MNLIFSWLLMAVSVWVTALILPGFKVKGLWGAIVVAALFGVLNFFLGWLLFVMIGLGTLGLGFLLAFITRAVVDAIVLKLVDAMTSKLEIRSFGWAFIGGIIMSGLATLAEYFLHHPASEAPMEISL